jgi:hypothetical protein
MLTPDQLPAPETLVAYEDGSCAAVMFHYASVETDLGAIADEHGFDMMFIAMDGDVSEELMERYLNDEATLADWQPTVPHGWVLGGKCDHEDGPFAMLLFPRDVDQVMPTVSEVGTA